MGPMQHATITPQLGTVLDTMIRQQPQERFQSAREVFEQLRPLLPADVTLNQSLPTLPVTPSEPQTDSLAQPDPSFIAQCRDELVRCI
ncbi:MAG: hypothetical protein AAGL17_25740, partial [Cyanobacteria bacterium J06576_12]